MIKRYVYTHRIVHIYARSAMILLCAVLWHGYDARAEGISEAITAMTTSVGEPMPAEQLLHVGPDDYTQGSADAPVTVVEYASLTCSHCAEFMHTLFPQITSTYIDTGIVRWVYRDFPLDIQALHASMLAHCAGRLGTKGTPALEPGGAHTPEATERYIAFVHTFFQTQAQWAGRKNYQEVLGTIARLGGLSAESVASCLEDQTLENYILERRIQATQSLNITATPMFFINGNALRGVQSFEVFRNAIESARSSSGADK